MNQRILLERLGVVGVVVALVAGCSPSPVSSPEPTGSTSPTAAPSATPVRTTAATSPSPSDAPPAGWPHASSAGITDALFGEDGRVVLIEGDGRITVLDGDGGPVPGWPWSPGGATGDAALRVAFGPDDSLYVTAGGGPWKLHRLSADGKEMAGFPVDLPAMQLCDLAVNGDAAYVNCRQEDAETATGTTEMRVVEPDGSTRDGWPVRMAGLLTAAGFGPDGRVYLNAWYGEPESSITALASDGTLIAGWPRTIPGEGEPSVAIDAQGRVRVRGDRDVAQQQCGLPDETVYTMLQADGSTAPGWPVTVKGWSSMPELADDGTMVVASATGKITAYSPRGAIEDGWPVSKVGVSVGCSGGSRPWAAGDGTTVVVGDGRATLLTTDGRVASGWPVTLPYDVADSCGFACTPGPGGPMDPAVGKRAVYIGAYEGDLGGPGTEGTNTVQPRMMVVERDGSMPPEAQLLIGKVGDTLWWLRIAPTGRVWALTVSYLEDGEAGTLHLVAEDAAPGS